MSENNVPNYANAATAYRDAYVNNMSGLEIVAELYKGILKNVRDAKGFYAQGQLDEMCNTIEKTNKILIALQSHLDFEKGGEAAFFLNEFYNSIFSSLTSVLRKPKPEEEFDRIIANIRPVSDIWDKHAEEQLRKD